MRDVAREFGVSDRTVRDAVKEGLKSKSYRMKTGQILKEKKKEAGGALL